jgi:hypothetical protein
MELNLKRIVCQCVFALTAAAALATPAFAQQGRIQSVTFYTIKPDRVGDFQAAVKEYNAAYAKAGATHYGSVWLSLTGPRTYVVASYYEKWADLDAGPDPKLKDAAADVARINARIMACVDSYRRIIAEIQPDLSIEQSTEMPKMIRVLTTEVRPEKYREYLALVKSDILPAAQKGGLKLYEFSETMYGAPNTEVTSIVGMDNWAALDGGYGVEKALGKEGYEALRAKIRPLIVHSEYDEYRFQPELSYLAPVAK